MAEITLHEQSRITIRPAIVEKDESNNEIVVGMGTAQEISFEQLMAAVNGSISGAIDQAIDEAINGPIDAAINNAINGLDKLTPQEAPTIEVGETFDQSDLQDDFDNLVDALVAAGVLTEEP